MKKTLSILLVVVTLVASLFVFSACGDKGNTLTVYTEAGFAPYEFLYNGKVVGVDIAIMEKVAERLGKELVVTDVDFNTICTSVQSGKADVGAAGITIRPDRREQVDFSIPYSSTEQYIVLKKDVTDIKTVEDLKGKNIGVQNGTTSDFLIDGLIKDGTLAGANLTAYTSPAVAAASLGKIDAVVTDKLTAQLIAANNADLQVFALVKADGQPAAEVEEYGIAVQKGNTELLDAINAVLNELLSNGSMDQLIEEYSAKAKEVGA